MDEHSLLLQQPLGLQHHLELELMSIHIIMIIIIINTSVILNFIGASPALAAASAARRAATGPSVPVASGCGHPPGGGRARWLERERDRDIALAAREARSPNPQEALKQKTFSSTNTATMLLIFDLHPAKQITVRG